MMHDMDDAGEMSIEQIRTYFGHNMSTRDVSSALSQSLEDIDAAIGLILRTWKVPFKVKRPLAGASARISAGVKPEPREELEDPKGPVDPSRMSLDELLRATNTKVAADEEDLRMESRMESKIKARVEEDFGPLWAEKSHVSEEMCLDGVVGDTSCEPSKREVVPAESEVEAASFEKTIVKTEPDVVGDDSMLYKEKACGGAPEKPQLVRLSEVRGAVDFSMMSFDEFLKATDEEYLRSQSMETERMGHVKDETDSVRVEKATGREEKGLVSGEKMVPDAKEIGMGSEEGCIRNRDMQGTDKGSEVDRSSQRNIVKAEPDVVTVAESKMLRAEEKKKLCGDLQAQSCDGKKDVNPKKRKDMDVDAIDATPINWAKPKLMLENRMPGFDYLRRYH